jgi:hypothetical protein
MGMRLSEKVGALAWAFSTDDHRSMMTRDIAREVLFLEEKLDDVILRVQEYLRPVDGDPNRKRGAELDAVLVAMNRRQQ